MTLGFLRTRVGRRFLAVNLLSAFLPLVAITAISYAYVRAELSAEARQRVGRLSKTLTLTTLSALSGVVRDVPDARQATTEEGRTIPAVVDVMRRDLMSAAPHTSRDSTAPHELTVDELSHLSVGRPLLVLLRGADGSTLLIGRALLPWSASSRPVAWARVSPALLWGGVSEAVAGEDAFFCVFEAQTLKRVYCADGMPAAAISLAAARAKHSGSEQHTARLEGDFFVAARDVYLRHEFGSREWRVVVLQSKQVAYARLKSLNRTFALMTLGVAILIFLVSHAQIRGTTEPLARLMEGTRRLQHGDFTTPVSVTSDDEYAEVAHSFNGMARVLDRQLTLMRNLDAVDKSALGAGDSRAVIDEALGRFCSSLTCSRVTVACLSATTKGNLEATSLDPSAPVRRVVDHPLRESERQELLANPREIFLAGSAVERSYLSPMPTLRQDEGVLILPLIHDGELLGLVAASCTGTSRDFAAECEEARRLADRVAMALGNVQLVSRLNALSVGTLVAFARAIDANSPWTAGHSERVTRSAVQVGRELELCAIDLQLLECGGLLHDIGKIAVPAAILDKPGKLDSEEWAIMKTHPLVGFNILSPIAAFAEALPIVRSHHEKMDGTGYPDGLSGESIPYLARVLAVSDVFDALVSDRPYRAGLSATQACELIESQAGSQLDPGVVRAFLTAVRHGRINLEEYASTPSSLVASTMRARGTLLQIA